MYILFWNTVLIISQWNVSTLWGVFCTITVMVVCWSIGHSGCGPTVPCTHRVLPAKSLIQLPPLSLARLTKFYHKAYDPPVCKDVLHLRRHIPGPPGHLTFPLATEFLIFVWWWKKRAGSAGMHVSLAVLVISCSELSSLLSQAQGCSWGNSGAVKYIENTHFESLSNNPALHHMCSSVN